MRLARALWLLPLAVAACGDDPVTPTPDAGIPVDGGTPDGGSPTDGGDPTDGGGDAGAADAGRTMCTVDPGVDLTRDPTCPAGRNWIRFVEATVESEGDRVAGAKPQMCITHTNGYICVEPVDTCEDGTWFQELTEDIRCVEKMVMSVSKPGDFASTFCELSLDEEGVLRIDEPLEIYPVSTQPDKPPLGDATEARTVELQDGVQLELVPSSLEECFEDGFRCDRVYGPLGVRRIGPDEATPCFVDPAEPPDALYAFNVSNDVDGTVPVRLENQDGLAPGTVVDVFVLGGLFCTLPDGGEVEEGEWRAFGTATVSADGQFIEGGEIPCVNWFGYRAR